MDDYECGNGSSGPENRYRDRGSGPDYGYVSGGGGPEGWHEDGGPGPSGPPPKRPAVRADRMVFTVVGLAYGMFLLVSWLAQWGMAALLIYSGLYLYMGGFYTIAVSSLPMYLFGMPVCLMILRLLPRQKVREAGKLGITGIAAAFLISIFVMYAGNMIGSALMAMASAAGGRKIINPVEEMVTGNYIWVNVVLSVLIAPLGEEFLYRRMLIDRVRRYGDRTAILLSGLLFGLSHGNFFQFFYAFGLGSVFAYIYCRTGKLRYSVGLHMVINFMGSVIAMFVLVQGGFVLAVYGIVLLQFMVIGLICFIICRRRICLDPGNVCIPKGKRFSTVYLNLGMVFFFLVSAASFALNMLPG